MEMNMNPNGALAYVEILFAEMDETNCFDYWEDGDFYNPFLVGEEDEDRKWR